MGCILWCERWMPSWLCSARPSQLDKGNPTWLAPEWSSEDCPRGSQGHNVQRRSVPSTFLPSDGWPGRPRSLTSQHHRHAIDHCAVQGAPGDVGGDACRRRQKPLSYTMEEVPQPEEQVLILPLPLWLLWVPPQTRMWMS